MLTSEALLQELIRREELLGDLVDPNFAKQTSFVCDDSPLIYAFCTRRAGKTMGVAKKFLRSELVRPGHKMLYISQTRETAIGQLKDDCINVELDRLGILHKYNKVEARYTFKSGGSLRMLGMDANDKERKKALGQKYTVVVADEAQDYETDLRKLVFQILKPAMADLRGQIALTGTPSDNVHGLYYDVTTGTAPGWSGHKWTTFDNPHMAQQWRGEIADLEMRYGREVLCSLPWFRQQYLGEWVIDSDALVYRYDNVKNWIPTLPVSEEKWWYVLGIDLGWNDPTAFTLLAYRDYDRATYVVESWKKSEMYLSDVEQVLVRYQDKYPSLTHMVIDNADKQGVQELRRRTGLPLIAAEKAGKYDFIQILNSEMKLGNIKVVGPDTDPLIDEWRTLIWDDKRLEKGDHIEKNGVPNHCADAALYAWRYTYSYILREKPTDAPITTHPGKYQDLLSSHLTRSRSEWR